ncbi:MmcQ/YjbR family DNA-binding protein [Curtobacterium sp. MCBD17_040]|uniref:MmcQ/YjbR family DNA-binding protein n=1 Tax=Curtobacterium sp. MCBD17_040 TaxID=2175674 RepID=UPI000DAA0076|nr:MmcQ/YjbR family DNA-binding protein [Curtobacterium sp. MCBD17_040]WIB62780.1 MmcQ/YjbR family DNA-binding protein [Curtobacterium sp. MCBD17_040]
MDGPGLHATALRVAAGLPAVTQGQPFGEGAEVFKVVGKVFAIVSELRGTPIVSLKCRPPHAAALVRDHPEITPGYHLNKQHWITVAPGAGVDEVLVEDLVGNSYDLVVVGLPRHRRPLDPWRRGDVGDLRPAPDNAG